MRYLLPRMVFSGIFYNYIVNKEKVRVKKLAEIYNHIVNKEKMYVKKRAKIYNYIVNETGNRGVLKNLPAS